MALGHGGVKEQGGDGLSGKLLRSQKLRRTQSGSYFDGSRPRMKPAFSRTASLIALFAMSGGARNALGEEGTAAFEAKVKPFIERYCVDCHDAETRKADLQLDDLPADFDDPKTAGTWVH